MAVRASKSNPSPAPRSCSVSRSMYPRATRSDRCRVVPMIVSKSFPCRAAVVMKPERSECAPKSLKRGPPTSRTANAVAHRRRRKPLADLLVLPKLPEDRALDDAARCEPGVERPHRAVLKKVVKKIGTSSPRRSWSVLLSATNTTPPFGARVTSALERNEFGVVEAPHTNRSSRSAESVSLRTEVAAPSPGMTAPTF